MTLHFRGNIYIDHRTVTPSTPAETPHSVRAPSAGWVIWELRAETVRAGWRAQTAPLLHGLDGAVVTATLDWTGGEARETVGAAMVRAKG
mgnify:CR=1 FL=1